MQTFRLGAPPVVSAFGSGYSGFNGFIEGCILNSVIAEVTKVGVHYVHLPCSRPVPTGGFLFTSVIFSWERVYVNSGSLALQDAKLYKVCAVNLCNLVRLTQIVIYGIIRAGGECKMALTDKQRKWRNDWERANRCQLSCKVHKDYAAHAKQVVAENGDTVSGVLKKAMDAYLEEHGKPYAKPEK